MQKSKILLIGILAILIAGILFFTLVFKTQERLINATSLQEILQNNPPQTATIKGDYVYFTQDSITYKIAKESVDLKSLGDKVPLEFKKEWNLGESVAQVLIIFIIIFGFLLLLASFKKRDEKQKLQKEKAQRPQAHTAINLLNSELHSPIIPMDSNITFADVAGISEAKDELLEIVDYLKNPKKYQDFGVKLPKGVLLVGAPGVGKTLIAKALAGEAKVPFYYQSGASFVQIYVGMGAKRVHDLFLKAKLNAPSIIFIDEIDAVGKARGGMRNDEREATLNQLLTEMDGFLDSSGVIVIGATNNIESIDEALLRSGRFDRRIFIELPNLRERAKILEVHCRGKACDFDFLEVSKLCVGFSGAALASLINEAALNALKRGSKTITKEDILSVRDKVMLGVRKKLSFSNKEREILATYQAAKAFSAYFLDFPFEKITLLSDGLKQADKEFLSKNEMENQIKILLSGIAALEVMFSEKYSHAKADLQKAKELAHKMVESYGMGEFLLGKEEDILMILENCKKERINFFSSYRNILEKITKTLLNNEKLEYEEIGILINEV